jgi:hypothetical protein
MPSPGSAAQHVIDSSQPVLVLIKTAAKTERMRAAGSIEKPGFLGERFAVGNHHFIAAVGFGPDDDDSGTIYARFAFMGGEERQAQITVFKDVLTGRWATHYSVVARGPGMNDAIHVAMELSIMPAFTRDIGEARALELIEKLADSVSDLSEDAAPQPTV